MKKEGQLFIISAPSGTGKSTVVARLLERNPSFHYSVSYTTRPPRKGEKNGIDYRFVDEATFKKNASEGFFAEWANVHGALYGTPKKEIEGALANGKSVIFDIDVQGGTNLKKHFPDAVTIFLEPPSFEELRKRLSGRKTNTPADIEKRLNDSKKEMSFKDKYDYCVINDKLDRAVSEIEAIIAGH